MILLSNIYEKHASRLFHFDLRIKIFLHVMLEMRFLSRLYRVFRYCIGNNLVRRLFCLCKVSKMKCELKRV